MTTNGPSAGATRERTTSAPAADESGLRALVAGAGDRAAEVADVVRATADRAGEQIPPIVEGVRDGALEGARTIQALPDPSQRLLAAFSLGLGVGLSIAGAPRLVVAATLAPAIFVAATVVAREGAAERAR